jgi:cytochrome c-type biogenesis protein
MGQGVFWVAFLAGALAAFNPCGFALLPAYISHFSLGEAGAVARGADPYLRAARFGAAMSLGITAVFGVFALLLIPLSLAVEAYLPYFTVTIGLLLVFVSVRSLIGRGLVLRRIFSRDISPNKEFLSQIGYGSSFALASLSCTIGPFLAVTASAISSRNVPSVLGLFVLYALGTSTVIVLLALFVAGTKGSVSTFLRARQGQIEKFTSVFIGVVGLYIVWYGYYEIRLLTRLEEADPVIAFALSIQTTLQRVVVSLGPQTLGVILLGLFFFVVARYFKIKRTSNRNVETDQAASSK